MRGSRGAPDIGVSCGDAESAFPRRKLVSETLRDPSYSAGAGEGAPLEVRGGWPLRKALPFPREGRRPASHAGRSRPTSAGAPALRGPAVVPTRGSMHPSFPLVRLQTSRWSRCVSTRVRAKYSRRDRPSRAYESGGRRREEARRSGGGEGGGGGPFRHDRRELSRSQRGVSALESHAVPPRVTRSRAHRTTRTRRSADRDASVVAYRGRPPRRGACPVPVPEGGDERLRGTASGGGRGGKPGAATRTASERGTEASRPSRGSNLPRGSARRAR